MRRILGILLIILILLPIISCGSAEDGDGALKIVTTIFPPYDYARQITSETGERAELKMLLPPGSESHDYEPSLEDIASVGECDLFICVGGETDAWVDGVIEAVGGEVNVLRLMDHVPLLCAEPHDHGRGHHDHGEEYDEHVWTTPENAAILCGVICEELCRLDPTLSEGFRRSGEEYISALWELDAEYRSLAENKKRDVLIFADRFPFRYLTESMGLKHHAAFEGCSSDSEPSLSAIYHLTEEAREAGISVILTAELSKGNTADVIAGECGAVVLELHSCHNVSREDFSSGVTCLELMRRNLDVLRKAIY